MKLNDNYEKKLDSLKYLFWTSICNGYKTYCEGHESGAQWQCTDSLITFSFTHWKPIIVFNHGPHLSEPIRCLSDDLNGVFPKCFPWIQWQNICLYSKRTWTCHLLYKRPGCYYSTSKKHVRDRIFKLSQIHASVIYQIPWIRWNHWIQWKFCSI